MSRLISLIFGLALLPLAASCNGYDPSLDDRPFRCGQSAPVCPDGYEAAAVAAPVDCVCRRSGSNEPLPVDFVCNNDAAITGDPSGNESVADSTVTQVGSGFASQAIAGLSICPATDVDVFSINAPAAGATFQARINYNPSVGALALDILDAQGTVLATGVDDTASQTAQVTLANAGTYFARVSSTDATENNYQLQLVLSGP